MKPRKYTPEEVMANRRKYVASLRRTKRQCQGELFVGLHCCAVGLAARTLFGIKHEDDYEAKLRESPDLNVYGDVSEALGIGDGFGSAPQGSRGLQIDDLWHWNDRDELTFDQIADKLVEVWGL